jgi:predicted enzyme related to lactoylglutathione lyase
MPDHSSDPTQWRHANPILEVADVRTTVAYYERVFGLVPTWMWEENVGGVTTEVAPIELYFSRADAPTPSRLAVFVDDADMAYAKYRAAGAEIVDELETHPWGLRTFTVKDPDGNLIGISHEVHDPRDQPQYRDLGHDSVTS